MIQRSTNHGRNQNFSGGVLLSEVAACNKKTFMTLAQLSCRVTGCGIVVVVVVVVGVVVGVVVVVVVVGAVLLR